LPSCASTICILFVFGRIVVPVILIKLLFGTALIIIIIIIIIIVVINDIYKAQTSPRSKCAKSAVAQ